MTRKLFTTLASAFIIMMTFVATNSFADCSADGCSEPTVPVYNECVPGTCDAGFTFGDFGGNFEVNTGLVPNGMYTEACSNLSALTVAGAPNSGEASIVNDVSRFTLSEKVSADGNTGSQFSSGEKLVLDSKAIDGNLSAGNGAIQNNFKTDMYANTWADDNSSGAVANMGGSLSTAAMLCTTDGTSGLAIDEVKTNNFHVVDLPGSSITQQSQMSSLIKIEKTDAD